jgi:hypothetical protein
MLRNHHLAALLALSLGACGDVEGKDDHDHDHDHDHGVTTRVVLNFAPQAGGDTLSFTWSDPENDGDPIIDDLTLAADTTYDLDIALWNDLEDPAEEVTPEIEEGDTEHQFFFLGDAVSSPATGDNPSAVMTQAYADEDSGGLPIGLENTITTGLAGTGTLRLVLRHMPPEDGSATKVAGLADDVAEGGLGVLPGSSDIDVEFDVTVE